jgi:hypothetical protein
MTRLAADELDLAGVTSSASGSPRTSGTQDLLSIAICFAIAVPLAT